ncbi:MAG: tyrosine-type recombinase/integrase, partial [Bacteroidales bacterium]|nr:tyrosine-type recombinase/integrase [Bacteroidales bacterium]
IMFGLTYDIGLRISELVNLQIADVDLDRKLVYIRQSKGKKDRHIPMSSHSVRGIKKHLAINNPKVYLFENIKRKGMPISKTRVRFLFKEILNNTTIKKKSTPHTLRHSYATHQLEAGQNIIVLMALLGHATLQTTLIYLQTSQIEDKKKLGCLEYLYSKNL